MDGAIETTPLFQLKLRIWIHSAIGAALLVGLPAVALGTDHTQVAIGVLPGLLIWSFGYSPLRKKAQELTPEGRRDAQRLPPESPLLVCIGAFLSPLWLTWSHGGWIAAAWIFLAATIILRWLISHNLDIPVDRRSWGCMLTALLTPFILLFVLVLIFLASGALRE
jgi:hypothetical protein